LRRPAGRGGGRGRTLPRGVVQTAQLLGMPLLQAPTTMPLMLLSKSFRLVRIIARRCSITHSRQLCGGEQLELAHASIVPLMDRLR
jgi:hypothetical protein